MGSSLVLEPTDDEAASTPRPELPCAGAVPEYATLNGRQGRFHWILSPCPGMLAP